MTKNFAVKSMTAYAKVSSTTSLGKCVVEIQSLNRRFLEINLSLPKVFLSFEKDIRQWIRKKIGRGQINVFLLWQTEGKDTTKVFPNLTLAQSLKEAWEKVRQELNIESAVDLSLLAKEKDILFYEEDTVDKSACLPLLKEALHQALEALVKMKLQEGRELAKDLSHRIVVLRKSIQQIKRLSPKILKQYKEKLLHRLEEASGKNLEKEISLVKEIALLAEKVDLTEEIIRFQSHLQQLDSLLVETESAANEARGKLIDFLILELLREINTIGSKAADLTIVRLVITIKHELEKMREQVQNIE